MCETFILPKILVVDTLKDRLSVGENVLGGGGGGGGANKSARF